MFAERWPLRAPFQTAARRWSDLECVVVEIDERGSVGRGEAAGVYYLGETPDSMLKQINAVRADLENGLSRGDLLAALPAGGARNAVDCALWDLEARKAGTSVWALTGTNYAPVQTVMTLSIRETAELMAEDAARHAGFSVLKVKLDDEVPVERIAAVRAARPDATIVVDANQGFTFELLKEVAPYFAGLGVAMVEQPLARGQDDALDGFLSPVPLCADESCLHAGELDAAAGKYQMINIKLDKCGGLTAALDLLADARRRGLSAMVGNMFGTSLAMTPALLVAQGCEFADIDGPLHLTRDRAAALQFDCATVSLPVVPPWGESPDS